jgi:hypothetical protein
LIIQVSEREKVPRFRTTAIAALAATALLATSGAAYARDLHLKKVDREASSAPSMTWAHFGGALTDISPPDTANPYKGARATAMLIGIENTTFVKVQIKDLGEAAVGKEFGAHLHIGPCGPDATAASVGGHYNVSANAGVVPPVVNDATEVWLNFDVNSDGNAKATATVPFVPTVGNRSITFHAGPTIKSGAGVGTAGSKLACLPLDIKSLNSSN